jgi:hypothetical protein
MNLNKLIEDIEVLINIKRERENEFIKSKELTIKICLEGNTKVGNN